MSKPKVENPEKLYHVSERLDDEFYNLLLGPISLANLSTVVSSMIKKYGAQTLIRIDACPYNISVDLYSRMEPKE